MYMCVVVVQGSQYVHVEDEYYQKATEFQETLLRPVISDMGEVIRPLPVSPAQLMKPGIAKNTSCALGHFHLGPCDIWLFTAKEVVVHLLNCVYTCT